MKSFIDALQRRTIIDIKAAIVLCILVAYVLHTEWYYWQTALKLVQAYGRSVKKTSPAANLIGNSSYLKRY